MTQRKHTHRCSCGNDWCCLPLGYGVPSFSIPSSDELATKWLCSVNPDLIADVAAREAILRGSKRLNRNARLHHLHWHRDNLRSTESRTTIKGGGKVNLPQPRRGAIMQFLSENQHIKPPKRSRYSPETVKPDQRSAKDMSSIKLGGGAAGTRQGDRKRKRNPKYANGAGVGGSSGGAPRRQRVKGHKRSGSGDTAGAMTPNLSYMEETPSPEPVRYSGADMGATGGGVGGADALFLPPTHHAISPSHSSKRTRSDSIGTFAADLFNGPLPAANHIVLEFDPLEPIPTTMNLSSTPTAAAAAAAATNAVQPKLNEGGSAERLQKLQAYTLRIHAEREALRTENAEMRYKLDIMKSIVNKLLERDRQRERSASTASSSESSAPTAVV